MSSVASSTIKEDFYGVLKGVLSLWENKMLLDYTIEVENQQFQVHKVILAATSDYFKTMLTGGMVESGTDKVRLEGVTALAVANMIHSMYKGEFSSTKPDLEELVAAATYLQMPGAINDCKQLLAEDITPQNCFKLLSMLQTYSATDCIEETINYIKSHFEDVQEAWRPGEMTFTDIKTFVDLWQKSEWDLFLAIKHWVEVDRENHQQYLDELMAYIRFGLMTPEQLEAIRAIDLYSGAEGVWCENVRRALEYHTLPTHAKVLYNSEQITVKDDPHPFYMNVATQDNYQLKEDTSLTGSYLNGKPLLKCMTWQKCKASGTLKPKRNREIGTIVVVNNFLIVCEEYLFDQDFYILDPRTMKWSPMATPNRLRQDCALVYCKKHLYMLGGCPEWMARAVQGTDVIEKYDFETDTWSIIPSTLPVAVAKPGAAVIDDCIYVAGGWKADGFLAREFSTRLDCFDTSTQTWHSKASLPFMEMNDVFSIQVMELDNEKILFTMWSPLEINYYNPARNLWFIWRCANSLRGGMKLDNLVWHDDTRVLTDQKHTLFLLNSGEQHLDAASIDSSEEDTESQHVDEGVFMKWTVSTNGKEIVEKRLPELPVAYKDGSTRLMLLAVAPKPKAPLSMLSSH